MGGFVSEQPLLQIIIGQVDRHRILYRLGPREGRAAPPVAFRTFRVGFFGFVANNER